ncbi:MAG: HDOD domain-containing protein [Phycisphaerales bacterium]|nr:MAG: HDOD domain-containing protein [Phycisphaerales bacterium]
MAVEAETREKAVVAKALASIGEIATLPEVTVKIIEIVEDSRSTIKDLHEVIKRDPALSTKVLRVVNSAFYGLPGQIASVDRAIILLGLSAVKNIAIAASISRLFRGGQISAHFTAMDLWRHSLGVGVASRAIAKAAGVVGALDEVMLAGLIHDLGLLLERQAFADELAQVIDRCEAGEGDVLSLETEIIGADHQVFGDALTTKWRFPRNLRAVIGFHHCPDRLSPELQQLGAIIRTADILCCKDKIGFHLTAHSQEFTEELLETVDITVEQLTEIRDGLEDGLSEAEATLTI